MRMSFIPLDTISLIIHNSLSNMEKNKKELELVQIDDMEETGFKQNPLSFRGEFTPAKLGHRYYYRSTNGVMLEDKFTYSKDEARAFCTRANAVMSDIEKIRLTAQRLIIAHRVSTNKDTREKIEEKLKEKETEVHKLFLTIFA